MIVFRTWKDGHFVRPYLFLSARAASAIGDSPDAADLLRDVRVVPLPAFDRLPAPVADHPDMLLYRDSAGGLVVYKGCYTENRALFDALPYRVRTVPDPKSAAYPDDVVLNCLNLRSRLIGRCDAGHPLLTPDLTPLPVKQGYARCSVCMVGSDAAITADRGIADALESIGVRVLRIRSGYVQLPGYNCGFIGGASIGNVSVSNAHRHIGNRIGFFGELSAHPDGEEMEAFIRAEGYEPASLCPGPLTDFGGGLWVDS